MVTQPDKSQGLSRYFGARVADEPMAPFNPNPYNLNQAFDIRNVNYAMQNSSFINVVADSQSRQENAEEKEEQEKRSNFERWLERQSVSYQQTYRAYQRSRDNFLDVGREKLATAYDELEQIKERRQQLLDESRHAGENIKLRDGVIAERRNAKYFNKTTGQPLTGEEEKEARKEYEKRRKEIQGEEDYLKKEEVRVTSFINRWERRLGEVRAEKDNDGLGNAVDEKTLKERQKRTDRDFTEITHFQPGKIHFANAIRNPSFIESSRLNHAEGGAQAIQDKSESRNQAVSQKPEDVAADDFLSDMNDGNIADKAQTTSYARLIDQKEGIQVSGGNKEEFNKVASSQEMEENNETKPTVERAPSQKQAVVKLG